MSNKVFKTSAYVFFLTLFVKIAGFLREIIMGYFGGTSSITDAYNISNTIPNFFLVVITQIITIAFIPIFLSIKTNEGEDASNKFVNKCIFLILMITSMFSLVIFFFPDVLTSLFASGLDSETKKISTNLLKICCWSVVFQTFVIVFSSFLNAKKHFLPPLLCGLVLDGATVLFFILYSKTGSEYWIGFIQLVTSILQAVMLLIFAFKAGFRFKIDKKIFDKNIKKILLVSLPALISVGVYEINVLVDKNFGSYFSTGAISSLSYAQTINNLFYTLVVNSIILVAYTHFSDYIVKQKNQEAASLLLTSVKSILFITIPLAIVVSIYSKNIVTVLFMRGKFDARSVDLTYKNLICYVSGLPFLCLSFLAVRFLYANRNHYPAIIISTIGLIANIGFNFLSYNFTNFGVTGIALATTVSSIIQTFLLYLYISRKYGVSVIRQGFSSISIPIITSLLIVPILFATKRIMSPINHAIIKLALEMLIIVLVYMVLVFLFEPKYFEQFKKFLPRKRVKK